MESILPALLPEYQPTRATLHAYAHAVGAIPRAHGIAHPRWWHISLKVRPEGLVTDPVPLPGGGTLGLKMDLRRHQVLVRSSRGAETIVDMQAGASGTEMGDRLLAVATEHGLEGGYERSRFHNDEPRRYDPAAAEAFFDAFVGVATVFERHRVSLEGPVGPIQVWPHGFDLAFEWFGTKTGEHGGEESPAQLNLGFYPAGEPYFYSTPWPFDDRLVDTALPHGAAWQKEPFTAAVLPYAALQGDPDAGAKIADYARAVFEAAAPTLTAP